nr:Serine hydroxymethyltransferase [uncultured bacterium]
MHSIKEGDPVVYQSISAELRRQQTVLNMIPSENYVSQAVLEASGSVLMNKYSEGYPFKRYYQGNEHIDVIEALAIQRAKQLFGAEHVNVQPLSGSPANFAVFLALLQPGDPYMGLDLACGGHLTHGSPVNFSGKLYKPSAYGVDKATELLDMKHIREIALRERPKMIISGLTAYPRVIDFRAFQNIADEVGAIHMADISHIAGLVATGVHPSPFPFTDIVTTTTHKTLRGPRGGMIMCKEKFAKDIDKAVFPGVQGGPHDHTTAAKAVAFGEALQPSFKHYAQQIVLNAKALAATLMHEGIKLVTNGTDNHLLLIDLRSFGIGLGKDVAVALERGGICCNANTVPYDPSTPFKPSGLRLGTPILTTRGMKEHEMQRVGQWMAAIIKDHTNAGLQETTRKQVEALCKQFPVYSNCLHQYSL